MPATVADHVENIRAKGTRETQWLAFKFGRLQSLCATCHAQKTDRETGRNANRRAFPRLAFGLDGYPIDPEEWRENHRNSIVSLLIS